MGELVSIIVPVFNEEATIGLILDRLAALEFDKEVIIVDDGSTDNTPHIIRRHESRLVLEHMGGNFGKGAAVRRGLEVALGDVIVIQDADLELSPDVIDHLVQPIRNGEADAVYGSRFLEAAADVPWTRRLANRLLTFLTNRLYDTQLTDMETAHKAFRADLVKTLPLESKRFEIEVELTAKLSRSGARIVEIASPYRPRSKDEGKKIHWSDGLRAVKTIFRYRGWTHLENRSRERSRSRRA